jgi:hypothetical protein
MSFESIITDTATLALEQLLQKVQQTELWTEAIGRRTSETLRQHFSELNRRNANRRGYPRQNFWNQVRDSVSFQPGASGEADLTVTQPGFAARLHGGEIRPRSGKYLTIPAHRNSYGRRAREFLNLQFGFAADERGRMRPALLERRREPSLRRGRKAGMPRPQRSPLYWLVEQVRLTPLPNALPSDATLQQSADSSAEELTAELTRQFEQS